MSFSDESKFSVKDVVSVAVEDLGRLGVRDIERASASSASPKDNAEMHSPEAQKVSRQGKVNAQAGASTLKSTEDQEALEAIKTLEQTRGHLGDCQRCKLSEHRQNIVFGAGSERADLLFVGEAPGRDEDASGEPFVGRAGKLLTGIIEAIGLTREDVYICNVIKCRPPKNRNPEPDEIDSCQPFLKKQIDLIQPKVICTLGKFAGQCLLNTDTPISQLRGNFAQYQGTLLMPTYHPAYLLRNPSAKKDVWEDMKKVHAKLCELTGKNLQLKGT